MKSSALGNYMKIYETMETATTFICPLKTVYHLTHSNVIIIAMLMGLLFFLQKYVKMSL